MPGESWEDPQCVEAIKIARENIGDLKLKSDGDYVVPKHLRMNAQQKRAQLEGLETKVRAQLTLAYTQQFMSFCWEKYFHYSRTDHHHLYCCYTTEMHYAGFQSMKP